MRTEQPSPFSPPVLRNTAYTRAQKQFAQHFKRTNAVMQCISRAQKEFPMQFTCTKDICNAFHVHKNNLQIISRAQKGLAIPFTIFYMCAKWVL
jgi:hypothetical protein